MLSGSVNRDAASERAESHVQAELGTVLGTPREAHGRHEMLTECRISSKVIAAPDLLLQELEVSRPLGQYVRGA
jgi:hypothetical protein